MFRYRVVYEDDSGKRIIDIVWGDNIKRARKHAYQWLTCNKIINIKREKWPKLRR